MAVLVLLLLLLLMMVDQIEKEKEEVWSSWLLFVVGIVFVPSSALNRFIGGMDTIGVSQSPMVSSLYCGVGVTVTVTSRERSRSRSS